MIMLDNEINDLDLPGTGFQGHRSFPSSVAQKSR